MMCWTFFTAELARVCDANGPGANFGGSCGWASAGRFHPAPSQSHRFLNTVFGGHVRSVNSYNSGASTVILPYMMGPLEAIGRRGVATWDQIAAHSEMIVAFGGMAFKNFAIAAGGATHHVERGAMRAARERSFGPRQSAARRSAGRGRRRLDPRGAQSFGLQRRKTGEASPSDHR